jgi:syntaxin 8
VSHDISSQIRLLAEHLLPMLLTDQDGQLEQLSKAIARQRDLSLTISSELEIHEGLLEETDQALSK